MAQTLFLRAPFEAVAGAAPDSYRIVSDPADPSQTTVEVDGTDPALLKLQPIFPGELAFKPEPSAAIPADPSKPGSRPVKGDLYLRIAPGALKELSQALPSLNYGLIFAYLGVTLDSSFFNGTVLKALSSKGGYKAVVVGKTRLRTAAQLSNYFAQGRFGVQIKPTKSSAVYTFPTVLADPATRRGTVRFALGVRSTDVPFKPAPPPLSALPPGVIMAAPDFVPVPVGYFYRTLTRLKDWETLAADGHQSHGFYAALEAPEAENIPRRWRRLRVSLSDTQRSTALTTHTYDELSAEMAPDTGPATIYTGLNRLGELFMLREDGENFVLSLSVKDLGGVPISEGPDGPRADELELSWPIPGDEDALEEIKVTAHFASVGDPLAERVELMFGAQDHLGSTIIPQGKGKKVLSKVELVRPLQELLTGFGFGVTKDPSGVFDVATRHAVREFQREARMTERASRNGQPINAPQVTYTKTPTGIADAATFDEMVIWRKNSYRARTGFYISKDKVTYNDVGYANLDIHKAEVFARDSTVAGPLAMGSVMKDAKKNVGIASVKGYSATKALTDPALQQHFPGATWEKRAICEVVKNEAKVFEAINTWDDSFLSFGLFQWTLGNKPSASELPAVCSTLGAEDFKALFGKWGLATTSVTGSLDKQVMLGKFSLDGKVLDQDVKREFRSFRWAYRFYAAGGTLAFRAMQYRHTLSRLNVLLAIRLKWGAKRISAGGLLRSEFMRAVALDQHVNRPGHVPKSLQACIDAMLDPKRIVASSRAGTWYEAAERVKLKQEAWKLHKTGKISSLTADERAKVEQEFAAGGPAAELPGLQSACVNAKTDKVTLAADGVVTMDAQQIAALASLYKWRRENVELMTDPVIRWESIVKNENSGSLGKLLLTPNQFTP